MIIQTSRMLIEMHTVKCKFMMHQMGVRTLIG